MKPDVLIIGDSHSDALKQGCDALGISSIHMTFSGRNWHEGVIIPHRKHGIWIKGRRWAQNKFSELKETLGVDNLANSGLPVLGSFGFHLGRMVPPFGWNDHVVFAEMPAEPGPELCVSQGFVEDYVAHYRSPHFSLVRRFARGSDLLIVAPPPAFDRLNFAAFRREVARRIVENGAQLYDPEEDFLDAEGRMPADLLEADAVHGNAAYGRKVVEILVDRELLNLPDRSGPADAGPPAGKKKARP